MSSNQIITTVSGSVTPEGKNGAERRLNVVSRASSTHALLALSSLPGKAGKAASSIASKAGHEGITRDVSNSNYQSLAEYLAGVMGKAICISNRASFVSLPDRFEEAIREARAGKNGGYTPDGTKPGAKLAMAMHLKAYVLDVAARAEELREARMAQRVADLASDAAKSEAVAVIS